MSHLTRGAWIEIDMTPKEMMSNLNQKGFMQIDKCNNDTFIKVFLLRGETEVAPHTRCVD